MLLYLCFVDLLYYTQVHEISTEISFKLYCIKNIQFHSKKRSPSDVEKSSTRTNLTVVIRRPP